MNQQEMPPGIPFKLGESISPHRLMSVTGSYYDNAAVETFSKTIKAELLWQSSWSTHRSAEIAIVDYVNGFYNLIASTQLLAGEARRLREKGRKNKNTERCESATGPVTGCSEALPVRERVELPASCGRFRARSNSVS